MKSFITLLIFIPSTTSFSLPTYLHIEFRPHAGRINKNQYCRRRETIQQRYYVPDDDVIDILPSTSTVEEDKWTEMYNKLINVKENKKGISIENNVGDVDSETARLRFWVNAQLHQINLYTSGERKRLPTSMSIDRSTKLLKVLKELGYAFEMPSKNNTNSAEIVQRNKVYTKRNSSPWDQRYKELLEYRKNHGHCDVPQVYPDNIKLGHWVNRQRSEYRAIIKYDKKNSFLTIRRIHSLEYIGFLWSSNHNGKRWLDQYKKLVQYCDEHGHSRVPKSHPELGVWVHSQRISHKKKKLSPGQVKLLDNVDFCWSYYTTTPWEHRFEELCLYKEVHGDCLVPRCKTTSMLGRWVNRQRKEYKYLMDGNGKKTAMTIERVSRLNKIGFAWKHPTRGRRPIKTTQMQINPNNDSTIECFNS